MRRLVPLLLTALIAALAASACSSGGDTAQAAGGTPGASDTPSPTPTPTPRQTPPSNVKPPKPPAKAPPTSGPKSSSCINGWITPAPGTALYEEPLRLIAHDEHVRGPIVVTDMRYFVGGESPPPSPPKGYLSNIKRWYVKLWARHDPAFQGRFLVESRVFGSGISAVAPYRTQGFQSPDWKGFQYDSANPRPRYVPGLPGRWSGIEYDFVKGGGGLDFPGLPTNLAGCLSGT
jgi:hypothetical protein